MPLVRRRGAARQPAVASPIGTFTKKIQCQLTAWVMTPPASRPTAPPAEATKAKTPIAFACSRGSGNIVTIMPSTTAEVSAPPAPCTNRAMTSIAWFWQTPAHTADAAVNTASPMQEHPAAPGQVAQPAGEQQQAAERDQVGVHDPGQPGRREAQLGLDGRQRDVHDRHVEDDHQHAGAQHIQRQPARPIGGLGAGPRRFGGHQVSFQVDVSNLTLAEIVLMSK